MIELRAAIAAEWTKLWSVRGTWWSLLASAVLMALVSAQLAVAYESNNTNEITTDDTGVIPVGRVAIESVSLVQFVILALAILMVTSEYANGGIRTSLQSVPVRGRLLAAKVAVTAPVMFVIGTLLSLLGGLVAAPLLGDWGVSTGIVRDSLAVGAYLTLAGVLTVGIATILRTTAGALTSVFLLLMVLPILMDVAGSDLGDALPSTAGTHFMNGDTTPYAPIAAIAIVAVWTAALTLTGYRFLKTRDA